MTTEKSSSSKKGFIERVSGLPKPFSYTSTDIVSSVIPSNNLHEESMESRDFCWGSLGRRWKLQSKTFFRLICSSRLNASFSLLLFHSTQSTIEYFSFLSMSSANLLRLHWMYFYYDFREFESFFSLSHSRLCALCKTIPFDFSCKLPTNGVSKSGRLALFRCSTM